MPRKLVCFLTQNQCKYICLCGIYSSNPMLLFWKAIEIVAILCEIVFHTGSAFHRRHWVSKWKHRQWEASIVSLCLLNRGSCWAYVSYTYLHLILTTWRAAYSHWMLDSFFHKTHRWFGVWWAFLICFCWLPSIMAYMWDVIFAFILFLFFLYVTLDHKLKGPFFQRWGF